MKGFTLENIEKMKEINKNFNVEFIKVDNTKRTTMFEPASCGNCECMHPICGANFVDEDGYDLVECCFCNQFDFIFPLDEGNNLVCKWMAGVESGNPLILSNEIEDNAKEYSDSLLAELFEPTELILSYNGGNEFTAKMNGVSFGVIEAKNSYSQTKYPLLSMAREVAETILGDWVSETSEGNGVYIFAA